MEQIELKNPFKQAWSGQDPFQAVRALKGEVFRAVKSRRTLRFNREGQSYFAKIHWGVGWGEILKNWIQGKTPVVGAENEYQAIRLLSKQGVDTMTCVAFGIRGHNPASRESFIITKDLVGTESLEDVCQIWPQVPPPPALKRALILRLAQMCRIMHNSGLNHRDCYLCHFLLDKSTLEHNTTKNLRLYVIDLHRAQIRPQVPTRWREKDLAGLYFSALDIGLTRTDCLRFVRAYEQQPLTAVFRKHQRLWQRVSRKAKQLYRKEFGRPAQTDL